MNQVTRKLSVFLSLVISTMSVAEGATAPAPGERYIVILKQRAGVAPDVASLGGVIESRQDEQLVITIPAGSLAALKADQKVRYIERVGGQPSAAEDVLIGEPADPQPGLPSQSKRLTPRTLGSAPWDSGTYAYDGAGNIVTIGTDNYLYDGAQRLKQSSTKGTVETYAYDGFGNMKTKTNTTIPPVDVTTNRYMAYSYNEIGAVTSDGLYGFSYDALGQPLSKTYPNKDPEYYLYTASDERIGVQRGGWWTWSVRDESGKVLRQYRSSMTNPSTPTLWLEDYVWRDGLLLGSQRPVEMGGRRHFHLDHLGTPRLITADNGQRISAHDYYPFGDEVPPVWQEVAAGFDREDPMKFTGHERDYAGGMGGEDGHAVDYMHARYYSPLEGRFLSPDPFIDFKKAPANPRLWNRYAYVLNNPVRFTDPTGKYLCNGSKDECANFEKALNIVRQAFAEAQRNHTEGAGRLGLIVKMYGALGKDTGVNVNFGSSWGRMDAIVKGAGQVTITVDRNEFHDDVQGKRFVDIAGSIAHEGDHGLFGRANPIVRLTRSYDMLYREELSGYRSSGYVYQALGINDTLHAIWQVGTGWTPNLEHFAEQGAQQDCDNRGGCRP